MAGYEGIVLELERQELELTSPNVGIYVKLFACYLVQDRLYDAKFLWRRIPKNFKAENDEIEHLNHLLRALICNNHLDFLKLLKREWSEEIKTIMDDLLKTTHGNVYTTVENAYSSITGEKLSEAIDLYQNQLQGSCSTIHKGYNNDIIDKQPKCGQNTTSAVSSEHQLSKLTGFVSFLEN